MLLRALQRVQRGLLGKSKSLKDDTGMVVADGRLEEDRELIALEQYMGDPWRRAWRWGTPLNLKGDQ